MHEESSVIWCSGLLQLTAQKSNSEVGESKETILSIPAAYHNAQMLLHLRNTHGMHETGANTNNTDENEVA